MGEKVRSKKGMKKYYQYKKKINKGSLSATITESVAVCGYEIVCTLGEP